MHRILIVDDEPLIGQGLSSLLASSGIGIEGLYVAHNGYEALDYIRMEEIDLLITDIQMGAMSGIELMHQAKLIRPWIQTIVISAHETFQYAQLAMRLGAKDYLIKPLDGAQLLDSVRNVLLKLEKRAKTQEEAMETLHDRFRMEEPSDAQTRLLNELLSEADNGAPPAAERLRAHGIRLDGPYFAVMKLQLLLHDPAAQQRTLSERDATLLRYGALNIASELLEMDKEAVVTYTGDQQISIIMQWDESTYDNTGTPQSKLEKLDMLGRSLHRSVKRYLGLGAAVGISQIMQGLENLPLLNSQALQALRWRDRHPDHDVFYYGDFHESLYTKEEPSEDELRAQHNRIAERAKAYIDEHYAQKGLTLHEVAQHNHVSPNYLSYLFKKTIGMNLWEYVMKLRMEESRRLLLETDMRRYEIAERVGYESPEHFSKIFKKYYGMSPSELKK